jgi:hypothetical protein
MLPDSPYAFRDDALISRPGNLSPTAAFPIKVADNFYKASSDGARSKRLIKFDAEYQIVRRAQHRIMGSWDIDHSVF